MLKCHSLHPQDARTAEQRKNSVWKSWQKVVEEADTERTVGIVNVKSRVIIAGNKGILAKIAHNREKKVRGDKLDPVTIVASWGTFPKIVRNHSKNIMVVVDVLLTVVVVTGPVIPVEPQVI